MKRMLAITVKALPIILLFVFGCGYAGISDPENMAARRDRTKLRITVDPRIELMSVIFHLAGNQEYDKCRSQLYMRNLKKHFAGHRNHPVVRMAKALRETHWVGYNAPMSLAIHIKDVNSCREIVPFEPRPDTLDRRWRIEKAREFLDSCRDFVRETDFKAFLAKNQSQYDAAVARLKEVVDMKANLAWFDEYFGPRGDVDFNLVISILNGTSSYAARVRLEGRTKVYCVHGARLIDWFGWGNPKFTPVDVLTAVHEFRHFYCNPLVDKYMEDFRSFGEKYFPRYRKQMKDRAYGNWQIMMYESLVRACEVRHVMATTGRVQANRCANYHVKQGFRWTKELSELLGQYEKQRDKYQTLDGFMPEVVRFFHNKTIEPPY